MTVRSRLLSDVVMPSVVLGGLWYWPCGTSDLVSAGNLSRVGRWILQPCGRTQRTNPFSTNRSNRRFHWGVHAFGHLVLLWTRFVGLFCASLQIGSWMEIWFEQQVFATPSVLNPWPLQCEGRSCALDFVQRGGSIEWSALNLNPGSVMHLHAGDVEELRMRWLFSHTKRSCPTFWWMPRLDWRLSSLGADVVTLLPRWPLSDRTQVEETASPVH